MRIVYSLLFVLCASPVYSREWTDTRGRHAEAEFVSRDGDVVRLRTPDGKLKKCAWDRLSADDQAHIDEMKTDSTDSHASFAPADEDHAVPPSSPFRLTAVQELPAPLRAPDGTERRCVYIGYWGSLHLMDTKGTAGYQLNTGKYLSELVAEPGDKNYWLYRVTNDGGDTITKHWAISIKPDCCDRYLVWRYANGCWRRYEKMRGWGIGQGVDGSEVPIGRGPDHLLVPVVAVTAVTVVNATARDLKGLWVVFKDDLGETHKSEIFSVPHGEKREIGNMSRSPRIVSNDKNLEIAVRSADKSFELGVENGIPLAELIYHKCTDGKIAVGITLH